MVVPDTRRSIWVVSCERRNAFAVNEIDGHGLRPFDAFWIKPFGASFLGVLNGASAVIADELWA